MADVRLTIPDELLEQLQAKLGTKTKITDIAKDAITLFNWAVDERASGRLILSADKSGGDISRLAMPSIEGAALKAGKE